MEKTPFTFHRVALDTNKWQINRWIERWINDYHSLHRLSALAVKNLPAGKHADGGGLWLFKRDVVSGQWVLRYTLYGRRHEMGLGSIANVSLREAREDASKWRMAVRSGLDPIRERERTRHEGAKRLHTLADVARDTFDSKKAELKGEGKAGRWFSPLELHVLPKLGKTPIAEIDQTAIRDTLDPIWKTKADTARKALNRLNICFQHATALGLEVDIQATAKARVLLGDQGHIPINIPAMHWREVPEFYASLAEPTVTHLALRLAILTVFDLFLCGIYMRDKLTGTSGRFPERP